MGDLTIKILSAHNLIAADRNGKSDPYVTIELNEDPTQRKQKTKIIHKNLNPIWNQAFLFKALAPTNTIEMKVWDHDTWSKDDPLGHVQVSVARLTPHSPNNLMLDLLDVPKGKLNVEILYRPYGQTATYAPPPTTPHHTTSAAAAVYPPPTTSYSHPPTTMHPPVLPQAYAQPQAQAYAQHHPSSNNSSSNIQPQAYSNYSQGQAPGMSGDSRLSYSQQGVYPPPQPLQHSVGAYPPHMSNSGGVFPPPSHQSGPYPPPPHSGPYPPQQSGPYPPHQSGPYPPPPQQSGPYPPQQSGPYPPHQSGPYPPQQSGPYPPPPHQSGLYPPPQNGVYPPQNAYESQQGVQHPPPSIHDFSSSFQTIPPVPPTDPATAAVGAAVSLVKPGRSNSHPPMPNPSAPPSVMMQPQMVNSQGLLQGPRLAKFFVDVKKRLARDYIIIMDRSGSMAGERWRQAQQACMQLAPFACQADPDGITLYLFNDNFKKFNNLKSAQQVEQIFKRESPVGTTAMDKVIGAAFQEHFSTMNPTTILMITDGEPDSKPRVYDEIMKAASRMTTEEQLSISFIQIGDDKSATAFLQELDDNMVSRGARFDLVDTLSAKDIGKMSFDQLIQKSIYD